MRPERERLGPFVQMDETLGGGKGGPHKELALVAAEADGRVRLAHAETNDKATLKRFADGQIAADARVVTDGLASYDGDSLGKRPCERVVQTKAERRENDAIQSCHWTISLLKRWLLGTHACAVRPKHLQAYLDEYAFCVEPWPTPADIWGTHGEVGFPRSTQTRRRKMEVACQEAQAELCQIADPCARIRTA